MVSAAEKAFYDTSGYLELKNVFSEEEINLCSSEYDFFFEAKQKQSNLEATWAGSWKTCGKFGETSTQLSVLSIHNLQCHSAVFSRMVFNTKLLHAISILMDSPNILLHHTKAHVKPPVIGAPFPAHQDYHYFPHKRHSMVAIFIHMEDCGPENGGLVVFPGSHKLGPLENKSDSPTSFYVNQEKFSLESGLPLTAKKGDVVIFSYLLVHASFPNRSTQNRRMLLFQMVSAEDEPTKATHLSPCQGMVLLGRDTKGYGISAPPKVEY